MINWSTRSGKSAHAVAHVKKLAPTLEKDRIVVINLSGRGDKDVEVAARLLGRSEGLSQVGEG